MWYNRPTPVKKRTSEDAVVGTVETATDPLASDLDRKTLESLEVVAHLNHVKRYWHLDLLVVFWVFFLLVESDTQTLNQNLAHTSSGSCKKCPATFRPLSSVSSVICSLLRDSILIVIFGADSRLEMGIRTFCLWNSSVV
jgi:hypothetical protein